MLSPDEVYGVLNTVMDPEVPVISVVELGIVRDVAIQNDAVTITITPTYSGCPAMREIEADIRTALLERGVRDVQVKLVLSPAWTTDWITESGRQKLLLYGIAPPVNEPDKSALFSEPPRVACPKCKSKDTRMVSLFGSTACKAHYQCNVCQEPFDYFKCLK